MIMLNQPFNGQLGEILKNKMQDPYTKLTIFSAFAKNSGILRLKPAMEEFKENNGHIEAFIGVDAHGTSYEAVLNLFELCDSLYIVHSESLMTTFHSKVYMLSNDENEKWIAIGSNNLTGGGLWSNFESAICFDINTENDSCAEEIERLTARYRNPDYTCSMLIQSTEDLDTLLNDDYLRREISLRYDAHINQQNRRFIQNQQTLRRFGHQIGIHIPGLQQNQRTTAKNTLEQANTPTTAPTDITDISERMWFETRALTGGSRNILDLSKLGTIVSGSAVGTRYETNNSDYMLGSVAFFDIDPENTATEKSITVNYNGIDYIDCVIKFPTGELSNGSWRIQLKGQSSSGEKIHTVEGAEWLRSKIIVFEKIRSDYYVMYVLEEDELETLKNQSQVVATNGSAANSKSYGLL